MALTSDRERPDLDSLGSSIEKETIFFIVITVHLCAMFPSSFHQEPFYFGVNFFHATVLIIFLPFIFFTPPSIHSIFVTSAVYPMSIFSYFNVRLRHRNYSLAYTNTFLLMSDIHLFISIVDDKKFLSLYFFRIPFTYLISKTKTKKSYYMQYNTMHMYIHNWDDLLK
jgi:hypothetical protein